MNAILLSASGHSINEIHFLIYAFFNQFYIFRTKSISVKERLQFMFAYYRTLPSSVKLAIGPTYPAIKSPQTFFTISLARL